jgi:hypothetical protein
MRVIVRGSPTVGAAFRRFFPAIELCTANGPSTLGWQLHCPPLPGAAVQLPHQQAFIVYAKLNNRAVGRPKQCGETPHLRSRERLAERLTEIAGLAIIDVVWFLRKSRHMSIRGEIDL